MIIFQTITLYLQYLYRDVIDKTLVFYMANNDESGWCHNRFFRVFWWFVGSLQPNSQVKGLPP